MAYTEMQKREHIRELQLYLHGLSHVQSLPHIVPDGIYGAKTAAAVREFQKAHGLRPSGETNSATWNAIVTAYQTTVLPPIGSFSLFPTGVHRYAPGDTGSSVFLLQGILQAIHAQFPLELPAVSSTGIYDAPTRKAVEQFQQYAGLTPDGIVSTETWNHLLAALGDAVRVQ